MENSFTLIDLPGHKRPLWLKSHLKTFLSFSYRKLRVWGFSLYFKEQASKIPAANMFFLSVLLPFRYYLLMVFCFFSVRNYLLNLFVFQLEAFILILNLHGLPLTD